jgi:hypothetical protein
MIFPLHSEAFIRYVEDSWSLFMTFYSNSYLNHTTDTSDYKLELIDVSSNGSLSSMSHPSNHPPINTAELRSIEVAQDIVVSLFRLEVAKECWA